MNKKGRCWDVVSKILWNRIAKCEFEKPYQCGKCGTVYDFTKAPEKSRVLYNNRITERVCPKCGHHGGTSLKDLNFLDRKMLRS